MGSSSTLVASIAIFLLLGLGHCKTVKRDGTPLEVYAVSIVGPLPIAVTNLLDLTKVYELFSKYQLQFMSYQNIYCGNRWLLLFLVLYLLYATS
ncbi:hypothetical protein GW17_00018525 [Ensete ventricosum]|nr:hypothetical protein GW17_00018525 [Ensete ventricosum]